MAAGVVSQAGGWGTAGWVGAGGVLGPPFVGVRMGASNSPSVISFGEPPICLSTRSISPTGESSLPCAAQKNQASMRVPGRAAVRTPNVLSPRPVRAARYAATLFSLVGTLFRGPEELLLWFADIGVGAESNLEGRSVTSVCGLIGINQLPVSLGVFVTCSALQFTSLIPIWVENPVWLERVP